MSSLFSSRVFQLFSLIVSTALFTVSLIFWRETSNLNSNHQRLIDRGNGASINSIQLNRTYEETGHSFRSKCSRKSDSRGAHQKVIAYSVFGELSNPAMMEKFVKPLIENAIHLPSKLPGKVNNTNKLFFNKWIILKQGG